ncbi:MAG: hypothetical protein WAV95_16735 [Azonexus sp.]
MNKPAEWPALPGLPAGQNPAGSSRQRPAEQAEAFDWQACWSNFRSIYGRRAPAESSPIDDKRHGAE